MINSGKNKTYKERYQKLRDFAIKNGLTDGEINTILLESLQDLESNYHPKSPLLRILQKLFKILLFTMVILIFTKLLIFSCPSVYSLLMRNAQFMIYPVFSIIRKLAIPVLKLYPGLTELYDETCLLENPWFYLKDMDCWPCSTLQSVPDLTGWNITTSFNTGIPFTQFESAQVNFSSFISTLEKNRTIFLEDSPKVKSNNKHFRTFDDLIRVRMDLNPSQHQDTHILWRINRMNPARIIRKLFPKPVSTPNWWGQSIERFVMIDEARASAYHLPNPECNHVILRSAAGSRLIRLNPSSECHQSCKSSTILLSAGQTLWYNWWYWRPLSLPRANETQISIQYLTSFCS